MRDSLEFKELSKKIPNFTQKCKDTQMIDYFINKYPTEELLEKLKSNTKSYDEMQQSLEFIKSKIGYLFYDKSEVYF
jgi:cupin superfamily acireductone dioxygenase involved in methionine salvage